MRTSTLSDVFCFPHFDPKLKTLGAWLTEFSCAKGTPYTSYRVCTRSVSITAERRHKSFWHLVVQSKAISDRLPQNVECVPIISVDFAVSQRPLNNVSICPHDELTWDSLPPNTHLHDWMSLLKPNILKLFFSRHGQDSYVLISTYLEERSWKNATAKGCRLPRDLGMWVPATC